MDPIVTLICLGATLTIGMRVGYAVARRHNKHDELRHDVLCDQYEDVYEQCGYQEHLIREALTAIAKKDSQGVRDFIEKAVEFLNDEK